ncbi:molybdate ABC transporter substrate-binding protein [Nocardioides sp. Root151]|uniref:molybdate ABC transporter substrate-binding protein n=1 Tax=Nocardioides sp. Root151 TaxID=1736475 RepID=UPI0009E730FD|nr:molybdate ABC transporter substrate-binding protein [Nocardioides sp. Root151]
MRMRPLIAVSVLTLLPLTSCSSDDDEKQLTVLAAASLTGTFETLASTFEDEHDGVDVKFNFGSSTTLAEQGVDGAPGDVLATADEKSMTIAEDGDALATDPVQFATNELVLVVPADNPAKITGFDDLADTDWVRCADDVPCGRLALSLLEENKVTAEPRSLEVDVKSVLAKITSGEADAGFVYASDAVAAGDDVLVFDVPGAAEQLNPYFIAPLDQNDSGDLAQEWVDFVSSDEGRKILDDAGFGKP